MPLQTPSDYAHGFPKDASTHFTAHCKALADFLTTTHSADRDTSLSPYPLYVPPARIAEVYALFAALHPALTAIVRSWWARPDWHSSIPMSPKITRVLRSIAVTRPYDSIGSIRPDYLIPENPGESLRICEINARFIFNGFYHAVKHDSSVQALGFYGHWKPASLIGVRFHSYPLGGVVFVSLY